MPKGSYLNEDTEHQNFFSRVSRLELMRSVYGLLTYRGVMAWDWDLLTFLSFNNFMLMDIAKGNLDPYPNKTVRIM